MQKYMLGWFYRRRPSHRLANHSYSSWCSEVAMICRWLKKKNEQKGERGSEALTRKKYAKAVRSQAPTGKKNEFFTFLFSGLIVPPPFRDFNTHTRATIKSRQLSLFPITHLIARNQPSAVDSRNVLEIYMH